MMRERDEWVFRWRKVRRYYAGRLAWRFEWKTNRITPNWLNPDYGAFTNDWFRDGTFEHARLRWRKLRWPKIG